MSEESRLGREAIETAYALKQLITAGVRVFFYLEDRERDARLPDRQDHALADGLRRRARAREGAAAHVRRDAPEGEAGHVTGGRVFGYDNVARVRPDGNVARRARSTSAKPPSCGESSTLCADGHGLHADREAAERGGAPSPRRSRDGRLAGPVVRHGVCCTGRSIAARSSGTRRGSATAGASKADRAAAGRVAARSTRPSLRIVSDELWRAVQQRLPSRLAATY